MRNPCLAHQPVWAGFTIAGSQGWCLGDAPGEELRRRHRGTAPDREARAPITGAVEEPRAPCVQSGLAFRVDDLAPDHSELLLHGDAGYSSCWVGWGGEVDRG